MDLLSLAGHKVYAPKGVGALYIRRVNGHPTLRLPNTLNVNFIDRSSAQVLAALEAVAASTGSACHAGSVELSPVLAAMGVPPREGMGAVRFSLGRGTTWDEIDQVLDQLQRVVV